MDQSNGCVILEGSIAIQITMTINMKDKLCKEDTGAAVPLRQAVVEHLLDFDLKDLNQKHMHSS